MVERWCLGGENVETLPTALSILPDSAIVSRSISDRLPTEAQHKASKLEMPILCFRYHYHWKKNRLLLPTNSDYWFPGSIAR